jgi:monofunctional biosynthetic peptidoglycan transglycosylase
MAPRSPRKSPRRSSGWLKRILVVLLVVVFVIPPAWTLFDRLLAPPVTPLMLIRLGQGHGLDYRWRPLSKISPAFVQAAIAAEDQRFCEHHGFDVQALQKAMAHNQQRPGKIRGGSTISQQTAKNVFLWPDRTFVRKGIEAYFTVLIETLWGKRRIMETYLNVVELGPGIYGAEAAAQRYFGVDAAHLTNVQASRLAAVLPDPLKWSADNPGPYVQRRSRHIGGAARFVRNDGLATCVGRLSGKVPNDLPVPDAPPPPPPKAQAAAPVQPPPAEPAASEPAASSEAPTSTPPEGGAAQ